MTRPLMSDGTRYPRKRPVNWGVVRRMLRSRQERRDAKADGFVEVHSFTKLPWDDQMGATRILETRISRDRKTMFVKVEQAA